jgi:serine/threonine protein kinase
MSSGLPVERIGPYKVLQKIAAGGMGTVYLAAHERDHGFRKLVAIKQLHPHLEVGDEAQQRFAVEARIGASLAHPNIVSVNDLDTDPGGGLFFVMEYVHGCSLRTIMVHSPGPMQPALAAFIIRELARALDAAHTFIDEEGRPWPVIHRDVNPKNVLLSDSGAVKLTDFGIAKILDQQLTVATGLRGTIGYMSPEQARGETVDPRTDIYSCGVILYELLTGRRAVEGESEMERLASAQRGVEVNEAAVAAAPAPLRAVLRQTLARDRADRLPTAARLLELLEHSLRQAGHPSPQQVAELVAPHVQPLEALGEDTFTERQTATAPPTPTAPQTPTAPVSTGRRGLVLGAVGGAVLAAGITALALTWSGSSESPPVRLDAGASVAAGRSDVAPFPADAANSTRADLGRRPARRPHRRRRRGRLMFNTEPVWSVVWIDGKRRGNTPLHISLPAGRHRIAARPLGKGKRFKVTVRIRPGKTTRRVLTVE